MRARPSKCDQLSVHDLRVGCIIGTKPAERRRRQELRLTICLDTDISRAARSDALCDAVNYKTLVDRIRALAKRSRYHLIEALAESVAAVCLEDAKVTAVKVRVEKPGALPGARCAAVEIYRRR